MPTAPSSKPSADDQALNDAIKYVTSLQCPPGYKISWFNWQGWTVESIVACYKGCPAGYNNYGDKCYATCDVKDGKSDKGWVDFAGHCWPFIYDRGVGTLPDKCASDREFFQGLCWIPCRTADGYNHTTWSPETCSQQCPPNTVEGGFANCTKVNTYGRGWGNKGVGCSAGFTDIGALCYKWPFSFEGYNCPTDGCQANFGPIDPSIPYYSGCDNTNPDPKLHPAVRCVALNTLTDPNTGMAPTSTLYNTKQINRNDERCEENNSGVPYCYPKCDVGFTGVLNVCWPDCGPLRDDGVTCHRDWYDRGIGQVPGDCTDPNRKLEHGLCYIGCNGDFHSNVTMCIKNGCPDNTKKSNADNSCIPNFFDNSKDMKPAVPPVSDTINATWDLAHMGANLRTIVLNAGLILGCLLIVLLIFGYNATLRSKPIQA